MSEEQPVIKSVGVEVNLGGLGQPLTKLIEVVAQGIGTLYRPAGTVAQAYADSKARLILTETDIKQSELWERAASRLVHTEIKRQNNLDRIVDRASAALPDKVTETPVPKDWITHFFDAAQDVSDGDMQKIWGRILAGEVARPGATSLRTLEFLKTMNKQEAGYFTNLLTVCFVEKNGALFIVQDIVTRKALKETGADKRGHLRDIGLIASEPTPKSITAIAKLKFSYRKENFKFVVKASSNSKPRSIGLRYFSAIGQELSKVAQWKTQPDFISRLSSSLEKKVKVRIEKDK